MLKKLGILFCGGILICGCGCSNTETVKSVMASTESSIEVSTAKEVSIDYSIETPTPTPTPIITETPTPSVEEPVIESTESTEEPVEEITVDSVEESICSDGYTEYGTYYYDIPSNSPTYIGDMTITFYCPCAEHCNSNIGAMGVVLTDWYSCAMPDASYLGKTIYVDGIGTFVCQDISPDGICDIFVADHSEIPSWGMTTASVYMEN